MKWCTNYKVGGGINLHSGINFISIILPHQYQLFKLSYLHTVSTQWNEFSFWIFRMTLLNLKVFKTLNMWQITSIYLFIHISCSYHMDWACRSTGLNPCRVLINSFKLYHFWQNPHFPFKLHVVGLGLIPDREAAKFMKHQNTHSKISNLCLCQQRKRQHVIYLIKINTFIHHGLPEH